MASEIRLPDIGDFKDVPIIEIQVKPGQSVAKDDILLTLESDKATLDVPAPEAGVIGEIKVKVGDKVSQGDLLATYASGGATAPAAAPKAAEKPAEKPAAPVEKTDLECDVMVLGAGPGGYTAAFRAADLGQHVVLVERGATLGGVCLNVGCIPSKALLHVAKVIDEASHMGAHGVGFGKPSIDLDKLRGFKDGVVKRLTGGLTGLARQRKVTVVTGEAQFTSANTIAVETAEGRRVVRFAKAIIAAGSEPVAPGFIPKDPRIWDSTGALDLSFIPKRMLVLGGGIIGLEMATVYEALGAEITVIEMMDQLMPGADRDIVAPFAKRVEKRYAKIMLKTKVTKVEARPDALHVSWESEAGAGEGDFDAMLVSVGRRPNGGAIGAQAAGVNVDERGFIAVDRADAHQRQPHLRHRRHRRPADAGPQGHARGQGGGGSGERPQERLRRQMHPLGRLYRPRGGVGWGHGGPGEGAGAQIRQGGLPLGGERPIPVPGPRRGPDEDAVGRGERSPDRGRHRRPQRRRPHRRGRARHRDGLRRRGHRPDDPPAPDPVGDLRHVGGGLRGDADGSVHAEEEVRLAAPGARSRITQS